MSIQSEIVEDEQETEQPQANQEPYHPNAPSHELFDISTTVDPSYIISLIRKLLPPNSSGDKTSLVLDSCDASVQGVRNDEIREIAHTHSENEVSTGQSLVSDAMDYVDGGEGGTDGSEERVSRLVGEDVWEGDGCILWDLSASKTHAEFMVQNLVLEVLQANLMVSQSSRVKEISLGIIGNLACYEVSRKQIASTSGLIEAIVDQLFLDDTPCLCEACRALTLGLQGAEGVTWAKVLQPESILLRILWITENTLNPQLMEKSLGLLLAVLESEQDVVSTLLPTLMQLEFPRVLVNLLTFEMSKLLGEREPERFCVLDSILRVIEAVSVTEDYSQEISSNRELFHLLIDLVKFPDKVEVANSCVTAAVLIANILTDSADLASDISQDSSLLQDFFDIFPFGSDDQEARSALWSIIARLVVQTKETEMSPLLIYQYVSVFVSKSELIEDELLDLQIDNCNNAAKSSAKIIALRKIASILSKWTASKDSTKDSNLAEDDDVNEETVNRLLRVLSSAFRI